MPTMRDVVIEKIRDRMETDTNVFFLTGDFGAPALDRMRSQFKDRCINVGIAEQNLVNVATGLALEGCTVFAYAIAPFLTMRAFEQIRNHLALQSQIRTLNVNLVGVGAGLSYDLSGPSHHCFEDLTLMRLLPHIMVLSPSDAILADKLVEICFSVNTPKYLRLDAKPLPLIYNKISPGELAQGFSVLAEGDETLLVTTGYMTHLALKACDELRVQGIRPGVIDVFSLRPLNAQLLSVQLQKYTSIVVAEEAFKDRGGLGDTIRVIACGDRPGPRVTTLGFGEEYVFDFGDRDSLLGLQGIDAPGIARTVLEITDKHRGQG